MKGDVRRLRECLPRVFQGLLDMEKHTHLFNGDEQLGGMKWADSPT